MWLNTVRGRDFRAFDRFALTPHPRRNLILGDNGAGKSSLLEALCVLTRGASPRAALASLTRDGCEDWRLEATVSELDHPAAPWRVEVSWRTGHRWIAMNGTRQTQAALAARLPLQTIDPARVHVIDGEPKARRRLLDWGLFHVEQDFMPCWRRLQHALAQRNAALRQRASAAALAPWDLELIGVASQLDRMRRNHLSELQADLKAQLAILLPGERWTLGYFPGWGAELTLAEALARHRERDRKLQRTTCGPHCAELLFSQDGRLARGRASRGQQKLLAAAWVLAQCRLIERKTGHAPIVLLDDFAAELSAASQSRLWSALAGYPGQVFIAAQAFPEAARGADLAMFHVEHGAVRRLTLVE